jgi:hypothetical protein
MDLSSLARTFRACVGSSLSRRWSHVSITVQSNSRHSHARRRARDSYHA